MKKIRGTLSYANVVSSLCLFLLLAGGAAYGAGHLARNSVGTGQLKKNSVTTPKIKSGAVTGAKIKLSSVGKVPSAHTADTAGDASTLQGNAAGAFMRGGGQFFSARRELAVGESGVTLLSLPGLGPVIASCATGTTASKGGVGFINHSGSTVDQILMSGGGSDGGPLPNGETAETGAVEAVGAWTFQIATRPAQPVVATVHLSFDRNANNGSGGCIMIGQAALVGG